MDVIEMALLGGASALPLTLGMLLAGKHVPGATIQQRTLRALRSSVLLLLLSAFAGLADGALSFFLAILYVVGTALVFVLGHLIARPMGRSVGRWLEDTRSWATRIDAGERYREHAKKAAEARRLAETATGPGRALHVARGLEEAREAYDTVDAAHLELPREEARRALAWFLRAAGQVEEAARLDR
jgi:hypothetical protein